ncbi:MAG: hypothetical protein ACK53Y_20045, partial [bacterium]
MCKQQQLHTIICLKQNNLTMRFVFKFQIRHILSQLPPATNPPAMSTHNTGIPLPVPAVAVVVV